MSITTLALVAPGDIITSAQQNIVRSNFGVLDARTGGDPGAAGKIPVSDGATSSIWTVGLTAVLNALGFTPVNKAGDTMSGALTVPGLNAGASGIAVTGAGGVNVSGGPIQGGVTGSGGDLAVKGLNVGSDGILSAAAITGTAISGTTGSFSSDLAAAGNAGITGSGTFGGAVGSPRFLSNVADGLTPPYVADAANAGVTCTNVRAASAVAADSATNATNATFATLADVATGIADGAVSTSAKMGTGVVTSTNILDGTIVDGDVAAANKDGATGTASMRTIGTGALQAAAGNHTHAVLQVATGSYSGSGTSGTSKAVTGLGFTPSLVVVTGTTGGATKQVIINSSAGLPVVLQGLATSAATGALSSGQWSVNALFNVSGETYTWWAIG